MIDHAYYPHIIDLVFESATFDSLLALSTACREWRERALGMIDHVYEFNGVNFCYPFPTKQKHTARHCRILDISLEPFDEIESLEDGLELFQKDAPNLDTIRFTDVGYMQMPVWAVTARRLVYARFDPDSERNGYGELEDDNPYADVDKVVINHTSDNTRCHGFLTEDGSAPRKEVVFIFHGKELCSCCFADVLRWAQDEVVPVTVVGIETLPTQKVYQAVQGAEAKARQGGRWAPEDQEGCHCLDPRRLSPAHRREGVRY